MEINSRDESIKLSIFTVAPYIFVDSNIKPQPWRQRSDIKNITNDMAMDLMKMFLFTLLLGSQSLTAQGKVLVVKPITEKYIWLDIYWWRQNYVGGRPQLLNARSFTANSTVNSKSFDESKVTLKFSSRGKCDIFGHGLQDCYCCPDGSRKEYCHQTMEECRANCASCRPKC
jgi:hypothetical protein